MLFHNSLPNLFRKTKPFALKPKYLKMSSNEYLVKDFSEFLLSPSKLLDLPIEQNQQNYIRRYIKGVIFSHVTPTPLSLPKLVSYSKDALTDILDIDPSVAESSKFINFVAGNNLIPNSTKLAHRYGGHQFGVWAMQLGDGRAILIGEYTNKKGERWELQLKGSGKTPYSRDGDGRAVLRSSIREFLCSEAMFYLGIPTTRAAAIVVSEDKVMRDILYDGHPQLEPAAVVLRLSPSWFRIGSLELLSKCGETSLLQQLLDFIIKEHFPEIKDDENKVVNFLEKVFRLSFDLVIKWQCVGFTHGVLNTDNMSLLGLTIDYGPFGFIENYDPYYVPNHSDCQARYCYGRQVKIVMWNIYMLIKAISPLLSPETKLLVNEKYKEECNFLMKKLVHEMSLKLGFDSVEADVVEKFYNILSETKADFNMTFRELSETPFTDLRKPGPELWALKRFSEHDSYLSFIDDYSTKTTKSGLSDEDRIEKMCQLNPRYILRNWMAQQAINKAEKGDYSEVNLLLQVLKNPFTKQKEAEKMGYSSEPPKWAESLCLSCSS